MSSEARNMPEQELSIKKREQELFVDPNAAAADRPAVKPFPVYLRETPAVPLSSGVKAVLWIVGIAVLLILVAALWRSQRPLKPRHKSAAARSATTDLLPGHPFQVPNSGRRVES